MINGNITIKNETGLHARPAAEFVKVASSYPCEINIEVQGKTANAKSIIGILSMGITKGTSIEIICDGDKEDDALKSLMDYIASDEIE